MITLNGKFSNYLVGMDGEQILSFAFPAKKAAEVRQYAADMLKAAQNGKERLTVAISPEKKGRSLTANAYMWTLCEKIADAVKSTRTEIYRKFIREQNVYKEITINNAAVETFIKAWGMNGIGWLAEKIDNAGPGFALLYAYYGSSVYSSKQMAKLIDSVITECKELKIETLPPHELAGLVERWK